MRLHPGAFVTGMLIGLSPWALPLALLLIG